MADPVEVVVIGGRLYAAATFNAAFAKATEEHLARAVPVGASERQAIRALRATKTHSAYRAILRVALDRVAKDAEPLPAATPGLAVVARFPPNLGGLPSRESL